MTIIIALIIIAVLIVAHEFGHFLAARHVGVPVLEFSLGMGYKLYSFEKNGTEFSFRLIPLGGYVMMAGMDPNDDAQDGLTHRTPWEKIKISVAGPLMNVLVALVIYILSYSLMGIAIPSEEALLGEIIPDMPAAAGLKEGDRVTAVAGVEVDGWEEFTAALQSHPLGEAITLELWRNGYSITAQLTPVIDEASGRAMIGVYNSVVYERQGIFTAIKYGFIQTWELTKLLVIALIGLFSTGVSVDDFAGPVGITSMVSRAASGGFADLMAFTAFLSVNLGIMNMLPIPALDGSRVLLAGVEAVRRRPLDPEKEGILNLLGFLFLIIVVIMITYNDIARLLNG
ncbi:MAG: RIP metalloprotease RseP [Syntrophomonadaceae bacterium]|nr:RIP metalloprotease RseP [Syntrophomonadaceae bacterium]